LKTEPQSIAAEAVVRDQGQEVEMHFHWKQGASVRPSTRIILTLFVITFAVPIIGKFYAAYSRPPHRMASNDAPAKTSQALTPSGHRAVHVKAPEKPEANLKASHIVHEPEANTGE
jgi:hypothetical protein